MILPLGLWPQRVKRVAAGAAFPSYAALITHESVNADI
jgi:hypothetical protein